MWEFFGIVAYSFHVLSHHVLAFFFFENLNKFLQNLVLFHNMIYTLHYFSTRPNFFLLFWLFSKRESITNFKNWNKWRQPKKEKEKYYCKWGWFVGSGYGATVAPCHNYIQPLNHLNWWSLLAFNGWMQL